MLLCAAALGGCTPPLERSPATQTEQDPPAEDGESQELFRAVNAAKAAHGVPELRWHEGAAAATRSHSRAMAESGFFSHIDPERGDIKARLEASGVRWKSVAENLFEQQGCADPVCCAVEGWLKSPGHRENLLNPAYTHTGIGLSANEDGTLYYTQIFLVPDEGDA